MPQPIAANTRMPMDTSIRFFIMMLAAFLARVSPASTSAKPGCMRNTSTAATKMKMLSSTTVLVAAASSANRS